MGGEVGIAENCDIIVFHIYVDVLLFDRSCRETSAVFLQLNENFSRCVSVS